MRPAIAIALSALFGMSTTNALALDLKGDCQVLKQIVEDAKNSFKDVRSDDRPLEMGTATTFDASVTFSDSQWCKVVISSKFFNENYSCDLRNTTMEATESFIKQCLGDMATPDPEYQEDHFKVFRLASDGASSVSIFKGGFPDLVQISVSAAEAR